MLISENGTISGTTQTFLGKQTAYSRNGQKVLRGAYNTTHHDRQSYSQMLVRYRSANLTAVSKQLNRLMAKEWEDLRPNCYYTHGFRSANADCTPVALSKTLRMRSSAVLDTYWVTQGRLPAIAIDTLSRGPELGVSDISVGNLVVTPDTPLHILSAAIVRSNGDRFAYGDTISFLCAHQRFYNDVPTVEPHRNDLFLTTEPCGFVRDLYLPGFGSHNGFLALAKPLPSAGYCWFWTRPIPGRLTHHVSAQRLVLSSTDVRDRYTSDEALRAAAIEDGCTIH